MIQDDLADTDKISQVKKRVEIMKPKLGTDIVVMNPGKEPVSESSNEGFNTFSVGFDKVKFQPIIENLLANKA